MARVIIIAGASLAIAAALPADIDVQLVTATGCGVDELELLLSAGADRAALALMPILAELADDAEPIDPLELARQIAADPAVIGAIRDAYAELLAAVPPVPALHDTAGDDPPDVVVADPEPEETAS